MSGQAVVLQACAALALSAGPTVALARQGHLANGVIPVPAPELRLQCAEQDGVLQRMQLALAEARKDSLQDFLAMNKALTSARGQPPGSAQWRTARLAVTRESKHEEAIRRELAGIVSLLRMAREMPGCGPSVTNLLLDGFTDETQSSFEREKSAVTSLLDLR